MSVLDLVFRCRQRGGLNSSANGLISTHHGIDFLFSDNSLSPKTTHAKITYQACDFCAC